MTDELPIVLLHGSATGSYSWAAVRMGVVQGIDYLERNLRRFMRPARRHIALDMRLGSNRIEYQPLGVVGIISPWNYPVNLSLMPVVTAIAAGNRVMLKPSKLTPATNAVLASMFSELFPEEQVAMVSGDGSAFSSLPFDHLVFTGSTAVGLAVMKAASENLVPVTLELGGKSPTIVAKGSVQNRTVSAIVWGKLLSGGQTCIAPDYALVHESEINTFIESYDRLVKAAYPDGPTSEDYTSIVNDQQYSMLIDLIDDARAHGARIIEVGHRPGDATRRPHTLAPTVVLGVTDEMKIAHEEIFGPILPIFGYGNIDDAITYVNARPRPLALYYFGDDDADRRKVLDRTTGQRHHQWHDHARRARRSALRWGRCKRHGRIPWSRRLPHAQPCQGHIRAGPLEFHRAPARAVRQACRRLAELLPQMKTSPAPAGPEHRPAVLFSSSKHGIGSPGLCVERERCRELPVGSMSACRSAIFLGGGDGVGASRGSGAASAPDWPW
jgi:acyl-CoA reductase-like NAD-dependent aldehyde dehydrogenase